MRIYYKLLFSIEIPDIKKHNDTYKKTYALLLIKKL